VFKFITNRPFWVNLVAAIALALLIIFAFLHMLSWITRHGEQLVVPDVKNKNTEEAIKLLQSQGFDAVIQDSTYTDTIPRGVVIKQLPDPNSTVKVNRTVYLTVNCEVPPMIDMPELKGLQLDFALEQLQRDHLQLEDTIFKTDFARGTILEQEYHGSKIVKGTKLQWGSAITLVVSAGVGEENLVVPNLIGMKYSDAKPILDSLGILPVAVLDNTVDDTASAFIYKQNPEHTDESGKIKYIKPGMFMDIFLSKEMNAVVDTTAKAAPTNTH
jgi:beta-lactam-binding protein with PASTA domain